MSTTETKSPNSDLMVAVGAIMCIALGASVTYWITHSGQTAVVDTPLAVREGKPINAPKIASVENAQPATAPKEAPVAAKSSDGDFMPVAFSTLASYYYELPGIEEPASKSPPKDQIPAPIKALNDKRIALQGYMVPTDLKGGKCSNFLLVKDQSLCCFGRMPRMNEWVSVKTKAGQPARVIQDQPITVFGALSVGEVKDSSGEILSIYRLEADEVAGPLDL